MLRYGSTGSSGSVSLCNLQLRSSSVRGQSEVMGLVRLLPGRELLLSVVPQWSKNTSSDGFRSRRIIVVSAKCVVVET